MKIIRSVAALVCAWAIFGVHTPEASALYRVDNVTNLSKKKIMWRVPIGAQGVFKGRLGSAELVIPGRGIVSFQDIGSKKAPGCKAPTWGVIVTQGSVTQGFYYEGEGSLDVTVTHSGDVILSSEKGKVFTKGPCSFLKPPRAKVRLPRIVPGGSGPQ